MVRFKGREVNEKNELEEEVLVDGGEIDGERES